ncbi:hydroxymethylbilane synthase [Actinomadura alba]|uniref:Porphobilinogen deaminase n=1 Tax=Actinomadura alba TaxID=406431 RepID=A0ABR7LTZ8_9ACTN|nr:hydroxymethylbilane synthase [Actinomadura alba]MBC6468044.1 hydroxymethylbilane synthase [Actinomadura alba]
METVVIGVRGSHLAQAMVREYLASLVPCPVIRFKTRTITTDGDRDRKSPLSEVGGDGAFSSRLEEELLAGRIDVAVHSLKDLPTSMPPALALATTPPRADMRDALCGSTLAALRPGARVGTGSPRRIAQLKALRPDLDIVPIRGNVPPRLRRLETGLDAVVLAAAGLRRLGLEDQIADLLPLEDFPPSPGQGALGVQIRAADTELREMLSSVGDPVADAAVRAERALLAELHGGCSVPVGAYAVPAEGRGLRLSAQVTSLDGSHKVVANAFGRDPEALGAQLAATLVMSGAEHILREIRATV